MFEVSPSPLDACERVKAPRPGPISVAAGCRALRPPITMQQSRYPY